VPKPPPSPPSSDLDGVHEDEARNTDSAIAAGEDSADLALARRKAAARPDFSSERGRDDRSS